MSENKKENEIKQTLKEEKEKLVNEINEASKRRKIRMNPEKELSDNELLK